jgi:hypothetical protein
MSKRLCLPVVLSAVFLIPGYLQAQPTAHYVPGVEACEAPSIPGPGLYFRDYNYFYYSDVNTDNSGHHGPPSNFDVFTYAQVPRVIWMTPLKFLDADVGTSVLLPLTDQDVRAGSFDQKCFGVGDLLVDGILAWHPEHFDFVVAPGVWCPTGPSAAAPTADPGQGYWAGMMTVGATWWIDPQKTIALSALNRYEFNARKRYTDLTPGEAYTLEWGLAKNLPKGFMVGVAGYYQQKVTPDSGGGADHNLDMVASIGPDIGGVIPVIDVITTFRWEYEFAAENRARGQAFNLTFTKRF